jgi:hypothetical protein
MIRSIKLMAEYGGTILWSADPSSVGPVELGTLPLTDDLKAAIRNWAAAYDRTLNQDYPPDSGFTTPEEAAAFEAEGRHLWKELQAQLGPEYKVAYYSDREARLLE